MSLPHAQSPALVHWILITLIRGHADLLAYAYHLAYHGILPHHLISWLKASQAEFCARDGNYIVEVAECH
jgi:hypothetical protein